MKQVKEEVIAGSRPVLDYPVGLLAALEHLGHGARRTDDAGNRSALVCVLESKEWASRSLGRKTAAFDDCTGYVFFLPGDDHFAEFPASRRRFLELLFRLERERRCRGHLRGLSEQKVPTGKKSFESNLRTAYNRVIGRSRGATYVRIHDLRQEMAVSAEDFDAGLLRMRNEGLVVLSKHGLASSLPTEHLRQALEVSPGEYYYYVELRGD